MQSYWDDNDEKEKLFEKFNRYYGEFSDEVREDMQSRNIIVPSSVYDVLYSEARKFLVSKNAPKDSDILEESEQHRLLALSKIVPNYSDIQKEAEVYRKAQLAKNVVNESSILELSERFRREQLAKNEDITTEPHLSGSQDYRNAQLNKNVPTNSDVESDSKESRENQLSKNVPSESDIESSAAPFREDQLASNVPSVSDIETDAAPFRQDQLANNVPSNSDIETDAAPFRQDQLGNNVPSNSDIETDAAPFRQDQLANNVPSSSDIEADAAPFREDQLGNNVPSNSDIEADAAPFRQDQLGNNVPSNSDIESDTAPFRESQLGNNVPSISDIEADAAPFRQDQLGNNVPSNSDIESDTVPFRESQLGNNVPSNSDIEADAAPFRQDQLGNNVPSNSDIESDTVPFRESQLGNNVPSNSDIEADTAPFRESQLGNNVPNNSDIESDTVPFREDQLGNNVPSNSDIESDSEPFREDQMSSNVPSDSDILNDSLPYWQDQMASNVPSDSNILNDSLPYWQDQMSSNVPSDSDILEDSLPYWQDQMASNVPSDSDILEDSLPYWEDQMSSNVPSDSDILEDSLPYWEDQMASNVPSDSDILEDSLPYWQDQMSANVGAVSDILDSSSTYREEMLASNVPTTSSVLLDSQTSRAEQLSKNLGGGLFGINLEGFGTQTFIGVSRNYATGILIREALLSRNTYQPGFLGFGSGARTYKEGDEGLINANTIDRTGDIVKNSILRMHLQNGQSSLGYKNWNYRPGVVDIVSSTDNPDVASAFGTYTRNWKTRSFSEPNDTPLSAEDLMAKTVIGNPLDTPQFTEGPKSVTSVIDKISKSNVAFAQNYVPGAKEFIIGVKKDGTARKARQRYSVGNDYAPKEAGELVFAITNYAIDNSTENISGYQLKTMYFPPYIQSFQETEVANWNENLMLGRPEPVYTYNNSKREGSINFYVLTDYAQKVELGLKVNDAQDGLELLEHDFEGFHFTDLSDPEGSNQLKLNELDAQSKEIVNKLQANNAQIASYAAEQQGLAGVNEVAESFVISQANALAEENEGLIEDLAKRGYGFSDNQEAVIQSFSENYKGSGTNIYAPGEKIFQEVPDGAATVTSIRDTKEVLDDLKKYLAFQPAFFSGDKVDFTRRMSFLSKLTRPRKREGTTGFSFTTPPVAHIKLGDWLDHDVVVNSINKDYSDTVWCLERGSVQPLWSLVTISFTILGSYGRHTERTQDRTTPLTASDLGGYYNPKEIW